jgi:hypothetical protein
MGWVSETRRRPELLCGNSIVSTKKAENVAAVAENPTTERSHKLASGGNSEEATRTRGSGTMLGSVFTHVLRQADPVMKRLFLSYSKQKHSPKSKCDFSAILDVAFTNAFDP